MAKGITIGKANCLNDTEVHLEKTLPNIIEKLSIAFDNKDYEAMRRTMHRFKLVFDDLEDMVNELKNLKK